MSAGEPVGTRISEMSDDDLLRAWVEVMAELSARNLTRSANNPIADFAERHVALLTDGTLAPKSAKGYDVVGANGLRYQVKARRITSKNKSRQLGAIRNLDGRHFDILAAVLYDEDLSIADVWFIPHAVVADHATYRSHTNSHVLHARGAVLSDPRVSKIGS
jgi:hypothetical protein